MSSPLVAGSKFGKFEIVREIARGGMGVVYEAHDPGLQRSVALKILGQVTTSNEEDRERFLREARLAARLRHTNIVAVHEVGVENELPYFVMDYIAGVTFDHALSVTGPPGVPLSMRQKVEIVRKVALGVQAAHDLGIIHRDIKPANIIIDPQGEPHLADFGLARDLKIKTWLTQAGVAMGTPNYMSPEQASGVPEEIDERTDVYSLGAVLYHALTLRLPFLDDTIPAMLVRVAKEDPPPVRAIDASIDRGLEIVCQKAMAKEKEKRYQTAREFAEDLDRHLKGEPILAKPPGIGERVVRSARRHHAAMASVITAVLIVVGFLIWFQWRAGGLRLVFDTTGASVWVDGKPADSNEIRLKRGSHTVRAAKQGFREMTWNVSIGAGEWVNQTIRLEPRAGTLRLSQVPDGTRVRLESLDDPGTNFEFEAPISESPISEGTYRMIAWAPGAQRRVLPVHVGDGESIDPKPDWTDAVVWKYVTKDKVYRLAAATDLNGDGTPDIVIPSSDGKIYAIDGRTGQMLWFRDTENPSQTDPVILHLERDGAPDVIFGVGASGVMCLRGNNGANRFFFKEADGANRTYVANIEHDQDGDGYADPLFSSWNGRLTRISGKALVELRQTPLWSVDAGARIEGAPLVGRIRRGGTMVVAIATHSPRALLYTFDKGEPLFGIDLPAAPSAPPVLADVNGDGMTELVAPLADGRIVCISLMERRILWTYQAPSKTLTRPAAGEHVVVVGCEDGNVIALDGSNGTRLWQTHFEQPVRGAPAIGDVIGEGKPDVVVGCDDGRLLVLDGRTGGVTWAYRTGGPVQGAPLLIDLDYDGIAEIVVGSDDGYVYALKVTRR